MDTNTIMIISAQILTTLTIVFSVFSLFMNLSKKIDDTNKRVDTIKDELYKINEKLYKLDVRIQKMEEDKNSSMIIV